MQIDYLELQQAWTLTWQAPEYTVDQDFAKKDYGRARAKSRMSAQGENPQVYRNFSSGRENLALSGRTEEDSKVVFYSRKTLPYK